MPIELPKDRRKAAIASIIRYFHEHQAEEIGVIAASSILDFFLGEIAPCIANKTATEIIKRLQTQITELDIDFHEEEFQYWHKQK